MIGTRLAHYEITAHLGSGGMGEVYQATDSKLGRSVAIKVLPESFARDPDRLARFEREARVLASLNHRRIATIHGLEESGGRQFLVMELAAGVTLAQRIARSPLPIDEALSIASQIAEALEAAHEKGVIHRDLKPANIKVSADGQVKVLDFGLAKAFDNDSPAIDLSNSPTLNRMTTNAGVILGTAAYMSPEQAKGAAVDSRSDIFAFGAVLFEMLTGEPAFQGETFSEILAAVLKVEPDWNRLPEVTPIAVRRLLRRCLQKDRTWRLHMAADVRIEIEEARTEPEPLRQAASVSPVVSRRVGRLGWAVASLFAVALAGVMAVSYIRSPPAAPDIRLDVNTPPTPDLLSFAVSPDGRRLVFVASGERSPQLWLRPLDSETAQPLAGTESAAFPFWSPDSRSVGFFAVGKLKRIDVDGGLPQEIATTSVDRGGTWGAGGDIVFSASTNSPLFRVPSTGGQPVAVTKLDAPRQSSHRFPQFIPGSRQFLFIAQGMEDAEGIFLGSLDSLETRRLTAAATAGAYSSGWLFFGRQGSLVAQRLDLSRKELHGDPLTVANSVVSDMSTAGFSVSATGVITYRSSGASRRQLTWFDRSGRVVGTMGDADSTLINPALSPDGRRVAVERNVQGNTDIWILDGVRANRLTQDPSMDGYPVWSPDGSQIAFSSSRKGTLNLYQKPSSSTGTEELLVESNQNKVFTDWSHDGRSLLYVSVDPKTARDLWLLPRDGNKKAVVFMQTGVDERLAQFSPDGHWVAYQSNESGRTEIYVRPFPAQPGDQLRLVSTTGGIAAHWSPDGTELYYIAPDGKLMAVPVVVKGSSPEPGVPVALFQPRIVGGGLSSNAYLPQYAVAPDGRFLINVTTEDAVTSPITVLLNWKPLAN